MCGSVSDRATGVGKTRALESVSEIFERRRAGIGYSVGWFRILV